MNLIRILTLTTMIPLTSAAHAQQLMSIDALITSAAQGLTASKGSNTSPSATSATGATSSKGIDPLALMPTRLRVTDDRKRLRDPAASVEGTPSVAVRSNRSQRQIWTWLSEAQTHLRAGASARAYELYEKIVEQSPDQVEAVLGQGACALLENDLPQAARYYRHAVELAPDNSLAKAMLLGLTAAIVDDDGGSEAIPSLLDLITRQPESSPLYFVLGNLYARKQRWDDAAEAYRNGLRLTPEDASFNYNLAVVEDQRGRPDLAISYYRRSLREDLRQPRLFDVERARARLAQLVTASTQP